MPRIGLIACVLVLALPGAASAATTFGAATLTGAPQNGGACPGGAPACTAVLAPPAARAPGDGVVVAWRIRATAGDLAVTLRAVRPDATGRWAAVATDATERTIHGGAVEQFAARLPVRAGDALGLLATSVPGARAPAAAGPVLLFAPPFSDGAATRAADAELPGGLLLQGVLEADADADGYGDETQDACPADGGRHVGPCAAAMSIATAAAPRYAVIGGAVDHVFRVDDAGPSRGADTTVTVDVPPSARLVGLRASRGTCDGASCLLGDLPAGEPATVVATIITDSAGPVATTARVAASVLDATTADDTATATTTYTPPSVAPPPFAFPVVPCRNVRVGTNDDEVIDGTEFGDRLAGRGGRDLLRGAGAGDCLEGGPGADVLGGGTGDDRLSGGDGADRLYGDEGADRLEGGSRNDLLSGGLGDDTLLPGSGADRVSGGPGSDTVSARDGTRDVIDCGPGRDRARIDRRDRVRGCESVSRG